MKRIHEIKVTQSFTVEESAILLSNAQLSADFFRNTVTQADWFDSEKECVVVFILNRKNRIKAYNLVSLGSLSASLAHPREVLRPVIAMAGAAFILAHNHPSGDPSPSAGDMQITRMLREAAKVMDIPMLDHVVVGSVGADPMGKGHYSFMEAGLI